jgi:hypothetical protein
VTVDRPFATLGHITKFPQNRLHHGWHKRQQIRPFTNNFLSLAWNITELPHRIELAIPKNTIVFVFRFCYILAGKGRSNFGTKKLNAS